MKVLELRHRLLSDRSVDDDPDDLAGSGLRLGRSGSRHGSTVANPTRRTLMVDAAEQTALTKSLIAAAFKQLSLVGERRQQE